MSGRRFPWIIPCLLLLACPLKGEKGDGNIPESEVPLLEGQGSPLPERMEGLSRSRGFETFEGNELYRYIDGAADQYLRYGFEKLLVQEYSDEGRGVTVEIYRMKTPLSAFGIFSHERAGGVRRAGVGAEAISGKGYTLFYKSSFYVKVIEKAVEAEGELGGLSERVAKGVADIIEDRPGDYDFFGFDRSLLKEGMKYLPESPSGLSTPLGGFEARGEACGTEAGITLIPFSEKGTGEREFGRIKGEMEKRNGVSMTPCGGVEGRCLHGEAKGGMGIHLLLMDGFIVLTETEKMIASTCIYDFLKGLMRRGGVSGKPLW